MQDIFIYGTQYYRYPSPPPDQWRKDLENIRSLNFNTVKIWAAWGRMHTAEGQADFSDLLQIMDICQDLGLKVVVNTILENAPYWLIRQCRSCLYEASDGRKFEPISRPNTPGGGWPGFCLDNQEAREWAGQFLKLAGSALGGHPALWGWDVWNEVFFEPIDYAGFEGRHWCYCEGSQQRFTQWLQDRYSLEELSDAWRRRYTSWDEVYAPRTRGGYADWWDWMRFRVWRMSDELGWRTEVLREADPAHPITSHGIGYSLHGRCTHLHDEWEAAKQVDSWGVSAFPKAGRQDACEHIFLLDLTRSACRPSGRRFWHTEIQGGQSADGLQRSEPVNARDTWLWNWNALASGADGLLYWQYRPERLGPESPGYGLVKVDGSLTERAEAASEMAAMLSKHPEFVSAPAVKADVAIVVAHESQEYTQMACGSAKAYSEDVQGYYRFLHGSNIPVDFVLPEDLGQYRVAFLPFPLMLLPETAHALESFVSGGGALISSSMPAQFGDHGWVECTVPGLGLDAVFGARQKAVRWVEQGEADLLKLPRQESVQAAWYAESYEAEDAGGRWGSLEGPGAVHNRYGKGRTWLIGTALGASFQRGNPGAGALLRRLVDETGAKPHVRTSNPGLICRVRQSDSSLYVVCVGHSWGKVTLEVDERFGSFGSARELFAGGPVELEGNVLRLEMTRSGGALVQLESNAD